MPIRRGAGQGCNQHEEEEVVTHLAAMANRCRNRPRCFEGHGVPGLNQAQRVTNGRRRQGTFWIDIQPQRLDPSLVGSIGVTAASFGFVDLMNRIGVERRAYTSGAHKAFLDPFQPKNPEETVFWNDVLKQTHQQFIQSVKTGRGDRLKDADHPELFSGLIWTGEQAKQLGLIDKLGDVDYVARDLVGATSQVDFTVKDNAFDRFAKRLGASAAQQLSMALGFSGVSLR